MFKKYKDRFFKLVVISVASVFSLFSAANNTEPADSTAVNVREAKASAVTPIDQAKGTDKDVEITRRIRYQLATSDTLSTNAKNVKIVSLNGKVTLKGPVETAQEKENVVVIAKKLAGPSSVIVDGLQIIKK